MSLNFYHISFLVFNKSLLFLHASTVSGVLFLNHLCFTRILCGLPVPHLSSRLSLNVFTSAWCFRLDIVSHVSMRLAVSLAVPLHNSNADCSMKNHYLCLLHLRWTTFLFHFLKILLFWLLQHFINLFLLLVFFGCCFWYCHQDTESTLQIK